MRLEIPECRRCLFCVPLRCGIFLFGYLNVVITLLLIALEAWLGWGEPVTTPTMSLYHGISMFTQMWLPMTLYTLDVVFNIILIAGAHMKRKALLRAYYYYGITTTAATFVVSVVLKSYDVPQGIMPLNLIELAVDLCGFVVHIYLLLLVRSELLKSRYQSGVTFVNHVAEVVSPPPWGDGRNPL